MSYADELDTRSEISGYPSAFKKKVRKVTSIDLMSKEALDDYSKDQAGEVRAYKLSDEELRKVRDKDTPAVVGEKASPAQIERANSLMVAVYGKKLAPRDYGRQEVRELIIDLMGKRNEMKKEK